MRAWALAAALLALTACETQSATPARAAGGGAERAQSGLDIIPLTIATAEGNRAFRVEVARTGEQQNRGMMFRERLGDFEGMLFPTDMPEARSFWMKDTPEPLDLIFIRQDGTVARIAEETVPYSLDPIPSGEPVIAVLEIRGGRAAELGIAEGDGVTWSGGPAKR